MPKGQYRGVSITKELLDRIEKFIEENPNQGYSSLADFVADSCRRRLEELGVVPPMLSVMDINVEEGGNEVLLWDAKLKSSVTVRFTKRLIKVYVALAHMELFDRNFSSKLWQSHIGHVTMTQT